ncbi:MAG: mannose-1-phosphate guanylyltransferase [Bacteroidales bacterium]|nr:mannose-1-phosphate guanylyltransferase [Bacteroidales bacterium]
MINKDNYCIIMAGGIGSRFWPLSRTKKPKQFIDILGVGETLLQMTFKRFESICPIENIYIVTSRLYKDLVLEQLPMVNPDCVITEPIRRNTAPCIAYANAKIKKRNPNAKIVVAPSDHLILNQEEFIKKIELGFCVVENNDVLVTLGIEPTYPNTGFGYIQFTDDNNFSKDVKKVKLFTEKPEYEMALQFIKSGDFLWNAGIFIWSLSSIEKSMKQFLPEIYELFDQGIAFYDTDEENDFIDVTYSACPSISIDYGVMEKASNVYVIPSSFGWSDIGTWNALYEQREKDDNANSYIGKNVMTYEVNNCLINTPKDKLVILQGLDDYIVVDSDDVLMICHKSEEQRIKQFVTDVEVEKGTDYL